MVQASEEISACQPYYTAFAVNGARSDAEDVSRLLVFLCGFRAIFMSKKYLFTIVILFLFLVAIFIIAVNLGLIVP